MIYPRLDIITGFASKSTASVVFLANRSQESVEKGDNNFLPIKFTDNNIDIQEKLVTSTFYGLKSTKAIYRERHGAVVISDDYKEDQKFIIPKRNRVPKK